VVLGIAAGLIVLVAVIAVLALTLLNGSRTEWWADPNWSADDSALAATVKPSTDILLMNYTAKTGVNALRSVSADHKGRVKIELNVTNAFMLVTPLSEGAPTGKNPAATIALLTFWGAEDVTEVVLLDAGGGLIEAYTRDNVEEKADAAMRAAP